MQSNATSERNTHTQIRSGGGGSGWGKNEKKRKINTKIIIIENKATIIIIEILNIFKLIA